MQIWFDKNSELNFGYCSILVIYRELLQTNMKIINNPIKTGKDMHMISKNKNI